LLSDKFNNKEMFDLSILDKFYLFDESDSMFDVDENVKNCYFTFIKEFCSIVAPEWKSYLKICHDRNQATFKNILTRSDEAYALWLIHCLYEKCKYQVEYINAHGKEAWEKIKPKTKSGKHSINQRAQQLYELNIKLINFRKNTTAYQYWQDVFFDVFFHESKSDTSSTTAIKQMIFNIPISKTFD
jgi:uncharacterized protein (DUF2344 family)